MTMTTATETFVAETRRQQEAFMDIWTDGVKKFWGLVPAANGMVPDAKAAGVPTADEVVDNTFDLAEKVLAAEKAYIKCWMAAVKSMTSSTAWMAQNASKGTAAKKS